MIIKLEIFPNEIFLNIFFYLSWDEILISLWSLNKRINSLICSIFSTNKNGIILTRFGLSYKKFSTILLPLIFTSSSLSSCIKYIHVDGTDSVSFDLMFQYIFHDNDKQILRFPNLKSLYITQCLLSQPLNQTLCFLIQFQLNELTLSFDENDQYEQATSLIIAEREKINSMFQQLLSQIFSAQSQLTLLQLDISKASYDIHRCLRSDHRLPSNIIPNGHQFYCVTLRRLQIHLDYTFFLEHLIEHVPYLEQLSVHFRYSLTRQGSSDPNVHGAKLSNENWVNKVPKLKHFTLKSYLYNDFEFLYLKWLLNNVEHVTKLQIYLYGESIWRTDQTIWESVIDANFVRQYCLPDNIINLKDYSFYIRAKRQLSLNDIEKIINSFKINAFFIDHQWTNVKCFYDENMSDQYLFSSTLDKFQLPNGLLNRPCICDWSDVRHIWIDLHPSLYLFLEQLDELCPKTSSISVFTECYSDQSKILMSLTTPFKTGQQNLNNIQFRNITRLQFGFCDRHPCNSSCQFTDQDKERARVFAHIISMPVQLQYLLFEEFEWLLHVTTYAFEDLRKNALSTVRYAEFGIPSCNHGRNKSIHIGRHLVPLVSTFMPNLRTLRLWRPDDYPWTSLRPKLRFGYLYDAAMPKWLQSLDTSKSIRKHVNVFERDLCQLVERLKQFVFLDIRGKIHRQKVDPYRLMVQTRFPNSQTDVQISRFRLWI